MKTDFNIDAKAIITHPGIFHADEVCAIAYLKLGGLRSVPILRKVPTAEEIEDPQIMVLDIGGTHDTSRLLFDHHQKGGAGVRWDTEIPLATFGLVVDVYPEMPLNNLAHSRFVERVVEPVDAADCGWGTQTGTRPVLSFSACISGFNPTAGATAEERDAAFEKAVDFALEVIANELQAANEWADARSEVLSSVTQAGGQVLVLDQFIPWVEHVFQRSGQENLLYVAFPSERGGWCLQQVPKEAGSFEGRKPLPEPWRGLRGQDFAGATGLSAAGSATFCHPGGFICGAETKEDVLRLAQLALASSV